MVVSMGAVTSGFLEHFVAELDFFHCVGRGAKEVERGIRGVGGDILGLPCVGEQARLGILC